MLIVVWLGCLGVTTATLGLDVSAELSVADWQCLASDHDFAIVRAWHSYGAPDKSAPINIARARAAGFAHVDVYLFPCFSCGNPQHQVENCVAALRSANASFGQLWLDIEGAGKYWSTNRTANGEFFAGLRMGMHAAGVTGGCYASSVSWGEIFEDGFSDGADHGLRLWWSHGDKRPSFDGYVPYGGWKAPSMKQYNDAGPWTCGVPYDRDYY